MVRRRFALTRADQFLGFERLQDVVVGATVESMDLVVERISHREHDDGSVREGPYLPQRVEPVEPRQPEIEDHQIRVRARGERNTLLTARSFDDRVVARDERRAQHRS